ncbi:MAG: aminotransferase class V-fold PLP-dependent enzyme [Rhodobacteraceae bacterium]|nr:aminotransferase class V-fold PLP-dependent enzyme [Paracoccaceae bacterium]
MTPGYFLYHSIGQYPEKAAEMTAALSEYASIWAAGDDSQWPRVLERRAEFIQLWEALIGAPQGTLTTAENVTTALYSLIGALAADRLRGKRVLVTADCFPSLHFLLAGLADRFGFSLDTVPLRQGESWVRDEDILDRWGPDVGLALLTFVTSTASWRCDLKALTVHGRNMGSIVVHDLTQGIGIIPYSLAEFAPDVVVSTSLKWLCGASGAGIIQIRPDLIRDLRPELRGWFSQPNPFAWDLDGFDYAPDVRRFDHGTPSVLAAVASVPALRWHAAQDGAAILAHNRALQAQIIDGVQGLNLSLAGPEEEARRGGSVMVRLPNSVDAGAVIDALRGQRLHTDCRGQVMRLSPGVMTGEAHVARLIEALGGLLKT